MSSWTKAAKEALEKYFRNIRAYLAESGADADEVIEDLRRHLESEAAAEALPVVTETEVRRLLNKIGAPTSEAGPKSEISREVGESVGRDGERRRPGYWLLILGAILPAVTLLIELMTGMCAGAFFDPVPTAWHALLVGLTPVVNAFTWFELKRGSIRQRRLLGWANGAVIAICLFYAVLFLPLLLPGTFAIIFYGWGLLPWTPMLALIASVFLRTRLRDLPEAKGADLPGFWPGLTLGVLALAVVELPVWFTRFGLDLAASPVAERQQTGISWLRRIGHEPTLRRACYGRTSGARTMDVVGWIVAGGRMVSPQKAREIYYRITGEPFNSMPAPDVRTGRGRWSGLDQWTWDEDQGGDRVGGRVEGLYLHGSRLDAVVDPDAAWSYTEWILEFRNESSQQREARAQILLPPGGAVSRLTLWVNGEEREAAFAGRSRTRQAYQQVAIRQRRDPVLVTTSGPDRILMQCFPVPEDGGSMKVRIGITAPLILERADLGLLRWPSFLERNFTIVPGLRHTLWVESKQEMSSGTELLRAEQPQAGLRAIRGQIDDRLLASPRSMIHAKRSPEVTLTWCEDTRSESPQFIRQTITETAGHPPSRLVVIVDGSGKMADYLPGIMQALEKAPDGLELGLLVASDEVITLMSPRESGAGGSGRSSLGRIPRARGGQDNLPALVEGWNLAAERPGSALLWIHGPQPVRLSPVDALRQAYERRPTGPVLYDFLVSPGPDRVIEQLEGVASMRSVPRLGTVEADLQRLFDSWTAERKRFLAARQAMATEDEARAGGAVRTSLHLARLWALGEVGRLRASRRPADAVNLAARYQQVTSLSGAVVLETAEQYERHKLQPVDAATVPFIPEPSIRALMLLGFAVLLGGYGRKRKRPSAGAHARGR